MSDKHREPGARRIARLFTSYARREEGASAIEFGLIALPFFLLIMAVVEFGLLFFTQVALENIVSNAGRATTIGDVKGTDENGNPYTTRPQYIEGIILKETKKLIHGDKVVVAMDVIDGGPSDYREPELCLTNPPSFPKFPAPCNALFEDTNGDGVYTHGTLPKEAGDENALVQLDVLLPWEFFTPFVGEFFPARNPSDSQSNLPYGAYVIKASVVVRNEPFNGGSP